MIQSCHNVRTLKKIIRVSRQVSNFWLFRKCEKLAQKIVGVYLRQLTVTRRPSYMYRKYLGRVKRIWYLSPMRAAKVQANLRIRAVSPEPPLLAHTSRESRGTFRQKARSLVPMNGWACAVKICYDGMLEDTNSLVAAHLAT